MHDRLQGRRVVVIGGSGTLGRAVARRAHQGGAQVVIVSRTAEANTASLRETVGENVTTRSLDVTDTASLTAGLADIGAIDHLVFAVRLSAPSAPLLEADLGAARAAFESKLWGPWQCIRAAHTCLAERSSITLTSGIAGERIYPGAGVMALLNGATEALCRTLAVELAPRRVNAVSPGFVAPKGEDIQSFARELPVPRLIEADEVAESFFYAMVHPTLTGTILHVDGGARLV